MRYLPLVAALFAAHPAFAAGELVDGSDPAVLLDLAKGYGSAELDVDPDGDPRITGRIEGSKYLVHFYGCDDGKNCKTIVFRAAWTSDGEYTLEQMNAWNQDHLFGSAYLDSDGDPTLDMSANLNYGVSRDNLDDTFDWWKVALGQFASDVINK